MTEVPTRGWHCPSLSHRPHVDGRLAAHTVAGVLWARGGVRGSVCLQLNWRDGSPCRPGEGPGGRAVNSVLEAGLGAFQEQTGSEGCSRGAGSEPSLLLGSAPRPPPLLQGPQLGHLGQGLAHPQDLGRTVQRCGQKWTRAVWGGRRPGALSRTYHDGQGVEQQGRREHYGDEHAPRVEILVFREQPVSRKI